MKDATRGKREKSQRWRNRKIVLKDRTVKKKMRSEFSKPNFKLGHYLHNRCSTIFISPPFIICSLRPRLFCIKENRKVKVKECQA